MVLKLSMATPEDVERIAEVHLASFDSNPLLHAQFPTAASLASLHSILCQEMLAILKDTQNPTKSILVVRDLSKDNQIISFAKWDLPGPQSALRADITWHADVRQEYLDKYHDLAESAKCRVVGDANCYSKIFPLSRDRGS
jgi:hypothetical protein